MNGRPKLTASGILLAAFTLIACISPTDRQASSVTPVPILEPSPTATPTPLSPSPTAEPEAPRSILEDHRVISYYGHPFSSIMGILGEGSKESIHEKLKEQAEAFRASGSGRSIKLAFHLIYAVAQASSGCDGSFLYHTDHSVVQDYIDFTREHDMLLFLDLQNGRSSVEAEVQNVLPYLLDRTCIWRSTPSSTGGARTPGRRYRRPGRKRD